MAQSRVAKRIEKVSAPAVALSTAAFQINEFVALLRVD
jgi:hypothetical protein